MDAEGPSTSSTGTLCKLGAKMPPVPPPLPMHISKGLSRPSPAKHTQHKNSESAADWVSHVDERKKPEDLCPPAAPPPPIHLPRKLYAETIPSHSKRTEIRKPDSARSHPVSTSTEPVLSVGESKSPIEAKADCATQSSSKASVGGSRLVSGVQTSASTEAVKDFASMFAVTDAESFDHDKILCSSLLMLGMLDGHGDGPNDDLQRMLVMQLNECGILANLHDLAEIGNSSMKDKVQEVILWQQRTRLSRCDRFDNMILPCFTVCIFHIKHSKRVAARGFPNTDCGAHPSASASTAASTKTCSFSATSPNTCPTTSAGGSPTK